MNIFSRDKKKSSIKESKKSAGTVAKENVKAPPSTLRIENRANGTPDENNILATLLHIFRTFLSDNSLQGDVSVKSSETRNVGLGNFRGIAHHGSFHFGELKGIRLDVVIRFQILMSTLEAAESEATKLQEQLLLARDQLLQHKVLRLSAEEATLAEFISGINKWRKSIDFRVLYEHHYALRDEGLSLITHIPVQDTAFNESMLITNNTVAWSEVATPKLVVVGPKEIKAATALVAILGNDPEGSVICTRTFRDAAGAPPTYEWDDFIELITRESSPENHAATKFVTTIENGIKTSGLRKFLEKITQVNQGAPEIEYQIHRLEFINSIRLPNASESFEIEFIGIDPNSDHFDTAARVFLSAE